MDNIFIENVDIEKPQRKKRVLSEKQKEALKRGREKRQQKLKEKLNKQAEKDMVKQDKQNRKNKKVLVKEQEKVVEKLEKNKEENAIRDFKIKMEEVKNNVLCNVDDNTTFKNLRTYFNSIKINNLDDINNLKTKLLKDIETIKNKSTNNKEQHE